VVATKTTPISATSRWYSGHPRFDQQFTQSVMVGKHKVTEARRNDGLRFMVAALALLSAVATATCTTLLFHAPSTSRVASLLATIVLTLYFATAFLAFSERRKMMLNCFFAIAVGLYVAELFLFSEGKNSVFAQAAKRLGLPFDKRQRTEVLKDIRRTEPATTSYVPDQMIDRLGLDAKGLFPLSGISNITTVFCNELGNYLVYRSDEHGFNNPPGLYKAGMPDFVTIGDSFVLGGCVQPDQNVTSQLRARGFHGLSLGVAGSGPLIDLALLQEYAAPLRPRLILWFYTEGNDRDDFADEMKSGLLNAYFNRHFSQGLLKRQAEIDLLVRSLEHESARKSAGTDKAALFSVFLDVLSLRDLRYTIATAVNSPATSNLPSVVPVGQAATRLEDTFREAKERVESWGGKLWVVYLPDQRRYAPNSTTMGDLFARESTLRLLAQLGIPVIDFKTKMDATEDPLRFYAFRHHAHYTPEGYAMLADLIATRVRTGK
jgi:hypothetical protein